MLRWRMLSEPGDAGFSVRKLGGQDCKSISNRATSVARQRSCGGVMAKRSFGLRDSFIRFAASSAFVGVT